MIPILEYQNTGKNQERTRHLPSQLSSDSDQYKQKLKLSKSHPRAKSLTGKIIKPFAGETQAQAEVSSQTVSTNSVLRPQDKGDSQKSYYNISPTYPNHPSMTAIQNTKSASCVAKPTSLTLLSVQQPYNQKQIPNIASSIGNPVHSRSLSSAPM